ncbi:MAG TPA: D-alanyl-D-alanine carboxypeptidase/D-alanyl-D-alanine-endopeptidase [Gemmataceae bacterium]|nr:D-alanyl-D-alanine carboxypeptidase/D-alanyl-D-alanine-endopeptidase [Gemmataceae bacterium]
MRLETVVLRWWVVLCVILAPSSLMRAADDISAKLHAVIHGPDYKQAHWGILFVDADTGKAIYEHNPDKLFTPASTTKLYSCAAALIALGPDYKFGTPVYRRGDVKDGRLRGDLILVAQGDLTLGGRTNRDGHMAFKDHDHIYANGSTKAELTDTDPLAGLKELARQIKAAGIREITGDVLIDDRLFAPARGTGSGPEVLSPIIVNDNVVDVVVTPAAEAGKPASVRIRPDTNFVQMDAQVTTVAESKETRVDILTVGPRRFAIRGQIPVKRRPVVRIFPVDDPAAYARTLFIEVLRGEEVAVRVSPLGAALASLPDRDGYPKLKRVAVFESPPLSEAIKVTLKVSHNLYASTLPLLIAVKSGKRTLADGLRLQGRIFSDLGVDVGTISFGGGAGGANADCVTPRATVQLLQAMAKRPEWAAYKNGLPILGVDGTLHDAVPKESPARGKAWAKTGTISWTDLMNDRPLLRGKALAGVMKTATGRELCFAMFVNDVPLPKGTEPTREGKVLGKLCEIVYQHAP